MLRQVKSSKYQLCSEIAPSTFEHLLTIRSPARDARNTMCRSTSSIASHYHELDTSSFNCTDPIRSGVCISNYTPGIHRYLRFGHDQGPTCYKSTCPEELIESNILCRELPRIHVFCPFGTVNYLTRSNLMIKYDSQSLSRREINVSFESRSHCELAREGQHRE